MCKAASMVLTQSEVLIHPVHDCHERIIRLYDLDDGEKVLLRGVLETVDPPDFVRVELTPPYNNLSVRPFSKWKYRVDQDSLPAWYVAPLDESRARTALPRWAKKLWRVTTWDKLKEGYAPVNPLDIQRKDIAKPRLETLLREWDSVVDSVGESVWDSVWDSFEGSLWDSVWDSVVDSVGVSVAASVWDSVKTSVGASVGASVEDSIKTSVWESVGAYIGGLFPKVTNWHDADDAGPNPWQPLLTLWYAGYIPSFDGQTWRLHTGPDAKIIMEIEL